MKLDGLLLYGRECIQCPPPPSCNCPGQDCVVINRDCSTCDSYKCVPRDDPSSSSQTGGIGKGAVAGAVVAIVIFLALAVLAFLWYRRRNARLRAQAQAAAPKEVPAAADLVLNRPDPAGEKPPPTPSTERSNVRVYSTNSNTTIDLDPESAGSTHRPMSNEAQRSHQSVRSSNPFDDANSIQTAGTEGTNVIPIALVSPDSRRQSGQSGQLSTTSSVPSRPARSPDLDLNSDRANALSNALSPAAPAPSTDSQSQISGLGPNRNSYLSSASYSSEFLNEAPMIMTPRRQVLGGMGKAEFVNPSAGPNLVVPGAAAKPAVRSPLAAVSFTPDTASDTNSPPPTTSGFQRNSAGSEVENATLPWAQTETDDSKSRPASMATNAGSLISFGSATRVNVGMPINTQRQTIGRLVTPTTSGNAASQLQEQQRRALETKLQAPQEHEHQRRISGSSAISGTADSILESFSFALVNPSPLPEVARSPRTPPDSPASHIQGNPPSPFVIPPTPNKDDVAGDGYDFPAPDRRMLGMSTGSQLSTASSGLGSFPFQLDSSGNGEENLPSVPTDRKRASLDTLAITSDLSSYPLGYDRDAPPVPNRKS